MSLWFLNRAQVCSNSGGLRIDARRGAKCSLLGHWLEHFQELGMDEFVAADHIAGLERIVIPGNAAEDASGLAHDDLARGDVPGLQVAFPIAIETARADESHIQRGCAEPPQASDVGLNFDHLGAREFEVAASHM